MEEEKAAAYYDELTRKGSGAARFKQGLGFSSTSNDVVSPKGSALPSSSSFLSSFVRASSPSTTDDFDKQSQLQSVQNKLKAKSNKIETQRIRNENDDQSSRRSGEKHTHSSHRSRSRSRDRHRHRNSKRRSRSRSRDMYSRRKSRSRSRERVSRRRSRSRDRNSRSRDHEGRAGTLSKRNETSPRGRRREKSGKNDRNGGLDYSQLIQGYDKMVTILFQNN